MGIKIIKDYLMYNSHYQLVFNQIADGIKIKVLNQNESVVMTEFELQKGTMLPEHIHTSDHSAYLLKGKIRIVVNGVISEFRKGDSWCIKKDICHFTEAIEDSVVLEVFDNEQEKILNDVFPVEAEF